MTLSKQEREMINRLEERLTKIETTMNGIRKMVIGILIGVAIGAVIFGYASVKELVSLIK